MAHSAASYGVATQLAQRIYDDQSIFREKSNTVTATIGFVITLVFTTLSYLVDADFDWLPAWLPAVVPFVGFIGTIFGVNLTKNGMTSRQIRDLEAKANEMIDQMPGGNTTPTIPQPLEPIIASGKHAVKEANDQGESNISVALDELAKSLANRGK